MRKISKCYERLGYKECVRDKGSFYIEDYFFTISCENEEICFDSLSNILYIEEQTGQIYRRIKPIKSQP